MYGPEEHRFRFAAWAAARASSRGCQGYTAQKAVQALQTAGLSEMAKGVTALPANAKQFDRCHIEWCMAVQNSVDLKNFKYGRAAKLVNIYFKALFLADFGSPKLRLAEADDLTTRVNAIHPPIDRLLLEELANKNRPHHDFFREMKTKGWTNFEQVDYKEVINKVRDITNGELWRIEEFWPVGKVAP